MEGLEDRFKLTAGTEDGAWDFVRTHLKQLPVFVSKDGQAEVIAERQNYLLFGPHGGVPRSAWRNGSFVRRLNFTPGWNNASLHATVCISYPIRRRNTTRSA